MLRMDLVHVVRHKVLVEKKSQREVAAELGVSRNTIAKYLNQSEPTYHQSKPRARPTIELISKRIDELLQEWKGRTTSKQRITGSRVHRQLIEEGFKASENSVYRYLHDKRLASAEVYIPLTYHAGEVAQVDFFEVTIEKAGRFEKAWKFLMRLMYSGADFVHVYSRQDQIAFLDGHVRAFAYFQGVVKRIAYDNLGPAVKRLVGTERELTDRFKALASHYLFEPCFARPGEGHDKGGVESRGKVIRFQHLTPVPRGDSLGAISETVMAEIERAAISKKRDFSDRTIEELFNQERQALMEHPPTAFEARRMAPVCVTSKATVQIEGATYSTPSSWARRQASAWIGPEDIRMQCGTEKLTITKLAPGSRDVKYRHYLPELARKPQALRQVAGELLSELGAPFDRLWEMLVHTHGERDGARVLSRFVGAIVDHGEETVREAVSQALETNQGDLLRIMQKVRHAEQVAVNAVPEALLGYEVQSGHACDYDHLLMGGDL